MKTRSIRAALASAMQGSKRNRRRFGLAALVAALVVLGSAGLLVRGGPLVRLCQTQEDYRPIALAIQQGERPGDVIVINAAESVTAFLHDYAGQLPVIGLPSHAVRSDSGQAAFDEETATVATRFERVWLVRLQTARSDPRGYVEAWLQAHAFMVEEVPYPNHAAGTVLQLYLTKTPLLQEMPPHQHALHVSFGALRLEGYDLPLRSIAGGERAWITFYWRVLQPGVNAEVSLRLVDVEGHQWGQTRHLPYPAFPPQRWPVGSLIRHQASIVVPPGIPPGWYRLELRLYDADRGRPIEPQAGSRPGPLPLAPLHVDATWAHGVPLRQLIDAQHILHGSGMRFGNSLALRAYSLEEQEVRPGQWLHLDTYWQIEQPPGRDLALTVDLVDAHGQVVCSYSGPPVARVYPPASWRAGELLWGQHDLLVPADAQPGAYRLRIQVRDEGGRQLPVRNQWLVWTWGQETAFLSTVQVAEVSRAFSRPPMEHVLERRSTAGIDLLGFDGLSRGVRCGEALEVTLHWRAVAVPSKSYKVSLQLLAADRRTILAQEDSIPVSWTRPTTEWDAGEIMGDSHSIDVPTNVSPQRATLIVALYDEDSGRRVQWLNGEELEDYVVLCPVEIAD